MWNSNLTLKTWNQKHKIENLHTCKCNCKNSCALHNNILLRKLPSSCKRETNGSMVNSSKGLQRNQWSKCRNILWKENQNPFVLILQRISSHHLNLPYRIINWNHIIGNFQGSQMKKNPSSLKQKKPPLGNGQAGSNMRSSTNNMRCLRRRWRKPDSGQG